MTTPRNTNIELLRFVLMCFIFLWHILVHGYDLKMLGADGYQVQGSFALMAIGLTLFAPATYCFVFISGYYGIRFKLKKLITLLLWRVVVSVGAKVYQYIYQGEVFHVVDFMESLLPITSNKWWFMTDFIMLYVLSPILNEGFDRLQSKEKARILLLLCLFSFIGVALLYPNQGSSLVGLTMVYLLGRYWHTSKMGGANVYVQVMRDFSGVIRFVLDEFAGHVLRLTAFAQGKYREAHLPVFGICQPIDCGDGSFPLSHGQEPTRPCQQLLEQVTVRQSFHLLIDGDRCVCLVSAIGK